MPNPSRQPKSQPLDDHEARGTTDEALKDLLLASAIRLPDSGSRSGNHFATRHRTWVPAWLSTVLALGAIPLALLSYGSAADEEDFYL